MSHGTRTFFKQRPNRKMTTLIKLLESLNYSFDNKNRKDIRDIIKRIRIIMKTAAFSPEQGLIIQILSQLVRCRFLSMKISRMIDML